MKRVTAFVGSARKKHTYNAAAQLLHHLESMGEFETEIVRLSDYHLEVCRGCKLCCDKGEELCPLKDDRDLLIEKMMASDGVVFATPNYSFQVSALMKLFLDRLGFAFHRPRFFGKTFTSIVAQGVYGGDKIVRYLDFVGNGLGFNTVKGNCILTLEPISEKQRQETELALAAQAKRYYARMQRPSHPVPTLFQLMLFRFTRTKIKTEIDDSFCDYRYYRDQGWFESDFYYPTRLGPLKKGVGRFFDWMSGRMSKAGQGLEKQENI